jgi:tape measure domain-containing protein
MANITTTITMADRMSGPIKAMISSTNSLIGAMRTANTASGQMFDNEALFEAQRSLEISKTQLNEYVSAVEAAKNAQNNHNQSIRTQSTLLDGLTQRITGLVAAYGGLQGVKAIFNTADEFASARARLDLMNDGLQSTNELMQDVYNSAQNSRGSFDSMVGVVARFGTNAKDAFKSSAEAVGFAELVQKEMKIAGASTSEASAAMLQLSQALASGVLRGDELNSVFENAPTIIQSIAKYMDVPVGKIRTMAKEGQLTSSIVKNAIMADADEINKKFNSVPMTWGDVMTRMLNAIQWAAQPLLNLITAIGQHWNVLAPIFGAVAAVLGTLATAYIAVNAAQAIHNTLAAISAARAAAQTAATWGEVFATAAATDAQYGLTAAILACPYTWVIVAIVAIVVVLAIVINEMAGAGHMAQTVGGVVVGVIAVIGKFFANLVNTIFAGFSAIGEATLAVAHNMRAAFWNSIYAIEQKFYSLRSTAMSVIADIANMLNKLPFVKIDVSGLRSAASSFKAKAEAAGNNHEKYMSVVAAAKKGWNMNGGNAFTAGWAKAAYKSGAAIGDKFWTKHFGSTSNNKYNKQLQKLIDQAKKAQKAAAKAPGSSGSSKGSKGSSGSKASKKRSTKEKGNSKTAAAVQSAASDLALIRKLAEKSAMNKVNNIQVSVDMKGMKNVINDDRDIDKFVDVAVTKITNGLTQVANTSAEGA